MITLEEARGGDLEKRAELRGIPLYEVTTFNNHIRYKLCYTTEQISQDEAVQRISQLVKGK